MTSETKSGLSRRDMLKKGAVAGAVAWSVPMISSSPAFAATAQCTGSRPCTKYYGIKFDNDKQAPDGPPGGGGGGNCSPRSIGSLRCPGDSGSTLDTSNNALAFIQSWSISSAGGAVHFQAGIVPLFFEVKFSKNCSAWKWNGSTFVKESFVGSEGHGTTNVTTSGSPANGVTVTYTGSSISNVGTYFCA